MIILKYCWRGNNREQGIKEKGKYIVITKKSVTKPVTCPQGQHSLLDKKRVKEKGGLLLNGEMESEGSGCSPIFPPKEGDYSIEGGN